MMHYIIKGTMDEKIVGNDHPQVYKFIKGYDPDAENALFSLYKYKNSFPDYTPNLDGLMLSGSSKLTDIVSNGFSGRFFIISERTKELLENYNLCPHRFYPVGLYKRKVKQNYFLLNAISDYADFVDYRKSSFETSEYTRRDGNYEPIKINSKNDLLRKKDKLYAERGINWYIKGTEIVMKKTFNSNTDFFWIGWFDSDTYISERLKLAIESLGITGWDFIPTTKLIIQD